VPALGGEEYAADADEQADYCQQPRNPSPSERSSLPFCVIGLSVRKPFLDKAALDRAAHKPVHRCAVTDSGLIELLLHCPGSKPIQLGAPNFVSLCRPISHGNVATAFATQLGSTTGYWLVLADSRAGRFLADFQDCRGRQIAREYGHNRISRPLP
jgi:hypothetical protein